MENTFCIEYTRRILKKMQVNSYLLTPPYHWMDEYDGELRCSIWENTEKISEDFIREVISKSLDYQVSAVSDSFSCEYILLDVPGSDNLLLIGPFSYENITGTRVMELMAANQVPPKFLNFMNLYYAALPSGIDERWMKGVLLVLLSELWGDLDSVATLHLNVANRKELYSDIQPEPTAASIKELEDRYAMENRMLGYIAHGDWQGLEKMLERQPLPAIKQRFPDSLRSRKNEKIILNTLCRKAAEAGHVHPVYLDEISCRFALKIENAGSLKQLDSLEKEMLRKYCFLVQSHSLKNYSPPIRKVINQISFDVGADLSLRALAADNAMNPSYLSSLFKKETGMTLTAFVNQKRVDHAIYLLNSSPFSIQDIARMCGIDDVNYFTKLFKRMQGKTPSEYRNLIR